MPEKVIAVIVVDSDDQTEDVETEKYVSVETFQEDIYFRGK